MKWNQSFILKYKLLFNERASVFVFLLSLVTETKSCYDTIFIVTSSIITTTLCATSDDKVAAWQLRFSVRTAEASRIICCSSSIFKSRLRWLADRGKHWANGFLHTALSNTFDRQIPYLDRNFPEMAWGSNWQVNIGLGHGLVLWGNRCWPCKMTPYSINVVKPLPWMTTSVKFWDTILK